MIRTGDEAFASLDIAPVITLPKRNATRRCRSGSGCYGFSVSPLCRRALPCSMRLAPELRTSFRPDLESSSIAICRRPWMVSSRNYAKQDLHFLRGLGLLHALAAIIE
jgi:hypothetical protein